MSINPLFRSAAQAYDGRVAGVILTGALDDGVAGLAEIKRRGGLAIAQDPNTAAFADMPSNAIKDVAVDNVLAPDEIAALISKLAATERTAMATEEPIERNLVEMTCPDCGGPIWEERQGTIIEYRCRVGHAYSPLSILQGYQDTAENAPVEDGRGAKDRRSHK
jgi:two-component system chemotaxis response regulator CheB